MYQADRQPGDASQYTARCPGGPPAHAADLGLLCETHESGADDSEIIHTVNRRCVLGVY